MTYVIGGADVNDFDELIHYGKKGMKWGVRNDKPSGGSGRSSSAPAKPRPKMTPAQRKELGKKVVTAVLITAGGVGVASLAGPVAGAAVSAALKGVVDIKSSSQDLSGGPKIQIKGETSDGNYRIRDAQGRDMTVDKNILEEMLEKTNTSGS